MYNGMSPYRTGNGMMQSRGMPDFGPNESGAMGMGSSIPGLSQILNRGGAGSPGAPVQFGGGQGGMLSGSPMGELQKHSNYATRFQRMGGSGPSAGGYGF